MFALVVAIRIYTRQREFVFENIFRRKNRYESYFVMSAQLVRFSVQFLLLLVLELVYVKSTEYIAFGSHICVDLQTIIAQNVIKNGKIRQNAIRFTFSYLRETINMTIALDLRNF